MQSKARRAQIDFPHAHRVSINMGYAKFVGGKLFRYIDVF